MIDILESLLQLHVHVVKSADVQTTCFSNNLFVFVLRLSQTAGRAFVALQIPFHRCHGSCRCHVNVCGVTSH